jgi:ABC-2 type transport system ATP-binding protein
MPVAAVAEFQDIVKEYHQGFWRRTRLRALAGVTLRVEAGEVFGLLGPNRAGKTTLLKILLSLCPTTVGQAFRFGRPVSDRRSLARIGYMHENHAFPHYLTAAGLLQFYGALSLVPYEEVRRRVPILLQRVGLKDRGQEPIARFSKGMIQRLGVAQALINDPDLLVLDEPNEGLDLEGRLMVREVIAEQRRRGRTVLLVSHVLPEVEQLCDRVAVLTRGRLIHCGSLDALTHAEETAGVLPLERALQKLYQGSPA